MEELLSLKWNNHKSTFIHVLGILRDKQLYTDATIACEGKFYSVHKLVLSTCSDYFSAMLDRTNCKNPIIVLKDIKCEDLEALLDYMYLGEVNVRQSDLATLIKAAECLRVKGLAVPDDEPPPPRKTKASDNQSRRGDTSGSPPAKRKRRSEVDDGRDDVRPSRQDIRSSSPIHRSKSPSAPMSTPLSPVHSRNTPLRQPTEATVPPSPKTSQHQEDSNTDGTANNSMHNNQGYQSSDQAEPFVKVEMDDGGGGEVETYDLSNDGAFKEEGGDDGATSGGGGGESGNDLSNDLPEFLQQATSNPLQGGAFGHSSFAGSSSFQPGEMPGWQGDGSNIGFPHLNFGSTEGSSQQNAPGEEEEDGEERSPVELSGLGRRHIATNIIAALHAIAATSTSSSVAAAIASSSSAEHLSMPHQPKPNITDANFTPGRCLDHPTLPALPNMPNQSAWTAHSVADPSVEDRTVDPSLSGLTFFKCCYCSRQFIYKSLLDRHLRTHTNERPFKCDLCLYRAKHKANLKSHYIFKHPEKASDPQETPFDGGL